MRYGDGYSRDNKITRILLELRSREGDCGTVKYPALLLNHEH